MKVAEAADGMKSSIRRAGYTLTIRQLSQIVYHCLEACMNRKIKTPERLEFSFLRIKDVEDAFSESLDTVMKGEMIESVTAFLALGVVDRGGYNEDNLRQSLIQQIETMIRTHELGYKYSPNDDFVIVAAPSNFDITSKMRSEPMETLSHRPSTLEGQLFSSKQRDLVQNRSQSRGTTPGRVQVEVINSKLTSKCPSPTAASIPKSLASTFQTGRDRSPAQSQKEVQLDKLLIQKARLNHEVVEEKVGSKTGLMSSTKNTLAQNRAHASGESLSLIKQQDSDYLKYLQSRISGGYDLDQVLNTSQIGSKSHQNAFNYTVKGDLHPPLSQKHLSTGVTGLERLASHRTTGSKNQNSEFTEMLTSSNKGSPSKSHLTIQTGPNVASIPSGSTSRTANLTLNKPSARHQLPNSLIHNLPSLPTGITPSPSYKGSTNLLQHFQAAKSSAKPSRHQGT